MTQATRRSIPESTPAPRMTTSRTSTKTVHGSERRWWMLYLRTSNTCRTCQKRKRPTSTRPSPKSRRPSRPNAHKAPVKKNRATRVSIKDRVLSCWSLDAEGRTLRTDRFGQDVQTPDQGRQTDEQGQVGDIVDDAVFDDDCTAAALAAQGIGKHQIGKPGGVGHDQRAQHGAFEALALQYVEAVDHEHGAG